MLRMGRNPNEEKSQTQATDSSRSYSPYQSGETQRTGILSDFPALRRYTHKDDDRFGVAPATVKTWMASQ